MNKEKTDDYTIKSIRMRKVLVHEIEKMALKENRNFSNIVETLLIKAINDKLKYEFLFNKPQPK